LVSWYLCGWVLAGRDKVNLHISSRIANNAVTATVASGKVTLFTWRILALEKLGNPVATVNLVTGRESEVVAGH